MGSDITRLHHVGHVVRDMAEGLALYRRLGFVMEPPSYPAMAPRRGAVPRPFGVVNTHAHFAHNFVELATCVQDGDVDRIPGAKLVPLQAPAGMLPELVERIGNAGTNLAVCLDRFEGLHILMFSSPDIDAAATRLTAAGVGHGGVSTVRRRVETTGRPLREPVRCLEIDSDRPGARPGCVAEGRVGVAADLSPQAQDARRPDHPNGAVDLIEAMLCVADAELAAVGARYERYLGRPARCEGPTRVLDLHGARLVLLPDSSLAALLPGEHPAALPAFVAYTVAVRDIAATRDFLRRNGVPLRRTTPGDLFVSSTAALGAAIVFRGVT
ncbi:hypothetical protein AV521_45955 [Streptomyces sp. IMTB 2501]|uniref:VOC family protein n=1 Tax=Streptomyces sp. IMTB 2501 TaxID=1776340 RepID=UPI00096FB604|nr:VOC family protein [Streptomyces sp. IMTB 2501]OLZ59170.1 hypothetical protein AV521_45955 [Streptomyces sp. IMTB 2501]